MLGTDKGFRIVMQLVEMPGQLFGKGPVQVCKNIVAAGGGNGYMELNIGTYRLCRIACFCGYISLL